MQTNAKLSSIWASGDYIGDNRPVTRVSVQQGKAILHNFNFLATYRVIEAHLKSGTQEMIPEQIDLNHRDKIKQTYMNYLWNNPNVPLELPNVKSFSWQRGVDTDVASATLELWNVSPLPVGTKPNPGERGLDQRGWYTPWRGSWTRNPWGQTPNAWSRLLVPDNIVRTYQGYGSEWLGRPVGRDVPGYIPPEADRNLLPTGIWLIDRVSVSETGGLVTIQMRDVGRLLLEHMVFPPVIPKQFYPLRFRNWDGKVQIGWNNPQVKRIKITPIHHSNEPWYSGLQTPIFGHRFKDAFDGHNDTYWLSVGNAEPTRRFAYEWIEVDSHKAEVTEVRFRAKKTGYTAYISVMQNGAWQGTHKMNYHEDGIGQNGADIHYVKSVVVHTEGEIRVKLPKVYKDAQRVRLTFSNLQNFGVGDYHWRAGIREMAVYGQVGQPTPKTKNLTPGPEGANPTRYQDYSNIVRLVVSWVGFFAPKDAWVMWCDGTKHNYVHADGNYVLGDGCGGNSYGNFEPSGTNGPSELGTNLFDKRYVMDVINYVKDVLGFIFFVDETGRAQWRLPNWYNYGSWVRDGGDIFHGAVTYIRNAILSVYDDQLLLDLTANFTSSSLREGVFVADFEGKFASYIGGYNPNYTGLRRVAGWSDTHFKSVAETKQAAEMIAVRQLYTYRTDTLTIPGNPCLQVDDQIKILARVTGEGYVHYVKSISSEYDAESGRWTYSLDTFWLGDRSADLTTRVFDFLPTSVQNYIIGIRNGGAP